MYKKVLFGLCMLLLAGFVIAWTPTSNIDLKNFYKIINATDIFAQHFYYTNGTELKNYDDTWIKGKNCTAGWVTGFLSNGSFQCYVSVASYVNSITVNADGGQNYIEFSPSDGNVFVTFKYAYLNSNIDNRSGVIVNNSITNKLNITGSTAWNLSMSGLTRIGATYICSNSTNYTIFVNNLTEATTFCST